MKYIIVHEPGQWPTPYIFPNFIGHDDMALLVQANRSAVVGAGFVELADGQCRCFGKSTSLEVSTRSQLDSDIINLLFKLTPSGSSQ